MSQNATYKYTVIFFQHEKYSLPEHFSLIIPSPTLFIYFFALLNGRIPWSWSLYFLSPMTAPVLSWILFSLGFSSISPPLKLFLPKTLLIKFKFLVLSAHFTWPTSSVWLSWSTHPPLKCFLHLVLRKLSSDFLPNALTLPTKYILVMFSQLPCLLTLHWESHSASCL